MNRVTAVVSARSRLLKVINHPVVAGKNGGWYVKIPGLKLDDFNRAGLPSIAKLSRMGEMNYLTNLLSVGDELAEHQLTMFLLGREWTISPQFYSRAAMDFPMTLHGSICRIGQSSFDAVQKYFADEDEPEGRRSGSASNLSGAETAHRKPILNCVTRLVNVDTKTWNTAPLTKFHQQKLTPLSILSNESFPTLNKPTNTPDRAFTWRVKIRYDDLDFQFHANQASYLVYATECAAQAAHERYYSRIVGDIAFYPVKRAYGIYLTEALAGDELEISTWEDADDLMRLHFTARKQGSTVYYAQLDFFDSVVDLNE